MARNNANNARTDIDKYRKQLGKQEFKGRNKKNTLAVKARAQARKQESPIKTGLYAILALVMLLAMVYILFYFGLGK
ncbi:triple QxxK/R motif-containing protein-like [Clytia hemisphaerica]|uniref:triple QxxK/R motif-containing protein-like n=1 Tax=Clytia hemisphaerica TaxID=252671 RepID=UPI0034D67BB4